MIRCRFRRSARRKPRSKPAQRYPTDLTDAQWALIEPLLPPPAAEGCPEKHLRREIVNAILYLDRAGCAWRLLPRCFPPWQAGDREDASDALRRFGEDDLPAGGAELGVGFGENARARGTKSARLKHQQIAHFVYGQPPIWVQSVTTLTGLMTSDGDFK